MSMGFSRQEYWIGLPFPTPGALPNPGIEPVSFFFFLASGGIGMGNTSNSMADSCQCMTKSTAML